MAIEQFGQSLLSGQRQRQRRIANQQRKMQREAAIGTLVGAVGNQFLKSKTEEFLNNEANAAARINYKKYLNRAGSIVDEYKQAENFAGGVEAYLKDKRFNYLKLDADKEMPDLINYNEGDINVELEAQAKEWAAANVGNFKSAYESALGMGTQEEFEQAIRNGYEGPANMGDWMVRGITGMFTGKKAGSLKAASATRRRDAMLQAGQNIEAFDAAINSGWDVDSSERFNEAIKNKKIARDNGQREYLGRKPINVYIAGKAVTVFQNEYKITYRSGKTETQNVWDMNHQPTAEYLKRDVSGSRNTNTTQNVEKRGDGFDQVTVTYEYTDKLTGEINTVHSTYIQPSAGAADALSRVTDSEKEITLRNQQIIASDTLNDRENPELTYAGIAEDWASQKIPVIDGERKAGQSEKTELLNNITNIAAGKTRQLLNTYFESGEEVTGFTPDSPQLEAFQNDYPELNRLVLMSEIQAMKSQKNFETGEFSNQQGYAFDVSNTSETSIDLLASFLAAERSRIPVNLSQDTMDKILNSIDITTIDNLPEDRIQSLASRFTGDETEEDALKRLSNLYPTTTRELVKGMLAFQTIMIRANALPPQRPRSDNSFDINTIAPAI